MMPISRWSVIFSKFRIAFTTILLVWIIHASVNFMSGESVLLYNYGQYETNPVLRDDFLPRALRTDGLFYMSVVASGGAIVLTFGVSWLMSALLRSPSIAACIGLGMLMALFVQTQIHEMFPLVYALVAVAFGLGIFSFCVGTICFLEGVVP
jgi:hypothetical protein